MSYRSQLVSLALLIGATTSIAAQTQLRVAPSGRGTTEVLISLVDSAARANSQPAKIRIDYGQPNLRGRAILTDSLVPYDKAWRTGANGATILTTDLDLIVGGQKIPRGTYVLQSLPSHGGWKLLIQNDMGQSPMAAAMTYNPASDVARIDMKQSTMAGPIETLTMWLIPSREPGAPHGDLVIAWGSMRLSTGWSVK